MGQPASAVFPRYWGDATHRDFAPYRAGGGLIAVLPVGATEQHGPHLPLSVDSDLAAAFAAGALARLDPAIPASALPTQTVGLSPEHASFPGTLTTSPETLLAQWRDLGASVLRAGADKLLILNAHGGQSQIVELACNHLRSNDGMLAVGLSWPKLGLPEGLFDAQEQRHGIHAGAVETALMQAVRPALVRDAAIADFTPATIAQEARYHLLSYLGPARQAWQSEELHPDGAVGDATQASPAKGQEIFEYVTQRLVALLEDMHAAVPPRRAGAAGP